MDFYLIKNWNDRVHGNDAVYFLGDLSFHSVGKTIEIVKRLNGKKYWIVGNHDQKLKKNTELVSLFEWVKDIETIYIQDPEAHKGRYKVVLSHYPMLSWDGSSHGSIHLHGHSHGTCQHPSKFAIDVGVDCFKYAPVSFDEIKNKIKEKT
jgi:calcineurin-like phosphoesterase family protein